MYGDFEDLETGETHDVDDVTSSEDEAEEKADDSEKKEGEDEPRKNKPLLHFCDCHCVANLLQKQQKIFAVYVAQTVKERQEKRRTEKLAAKKARTKAMFDQAYDQAGGTRGDKTGATFYDEWKSEMEDQSLSLGVFSSFCKDCFLISKILLKFFLSKSM